jgi:hypothetical protein
MTCEGAWRTNCADMSVIGPHVENFSSFHSLEDCEKLRSYCPIVSELVPCNVYDHDADRQFVQVMLELEAPVCSQEHIELHGNLWKKDMVLEVFPPGVKGCLHFMTDKNFDNTRINTSVYKDAHANCSIVRA